MKYDSYLVTFTEVPDEISLCLNLSNCPFHCKNCFEPWLREDRGNKLDIEALEDLISKHSHISCICYMGGDANYKDLYDLTIAFKFKYPRMKFAMYSGAAQMNDLMAECLDYYKVGPFIPEKGPLNNPGTNQRFYIKEQNDWRDITYRFQMKKD